MDGYLSHRPHRYAELYHWFQVKMIDKHVFVFHPFLVITLTSLGRKVDEESVGILTIF